MFSCTHLPSILDLDTMVSYTLATLSVMLATAAAAADKPVVTVFLYPVEGVQFNAAVVSANPSANLYTIDCTTTATTSMPPNLCSDERGLTILQGPKTVSAAMTLATNATTTYVYSCYMENGD